MFAFDDVIMLVSITDIDVVVFKPQIFRLNTYFSELAL